MKPRLSLTIKVLAVALLVHITLTDRPTWAAIGLLPFRPLTQTDIGPEIVRLTARLNSPDEEERRDAVMKLSALRAPDAAPALTSALNDRSERVRAAAITGLGLLGDPKLAPIVAARLSEDKRPFVRKTAAYALGRLRSPDGTPALVAALKGRDVEVRSAAAFALGEYQDSSAVEPLIAALADKSDFVRAQAARALGTNGRAASRALPDLIRLLMLDKENEVKRQAAITLGRIGDRAALPALNRTQYDSDPYLSLAALSAINMIENR